MVNKLADQYECPVDKYILSFIDTHIRFYRKMGFTPNMLTTFSILAAILTVYEIFKGNFAIAAFLWLVAYYFDCADGKFARKYNMVTKIGDLYDHFGDIFKYVIVIYALFYSSKRKITKKQWWFLFIILFLTLLSFIHLGYQERIYDKKEESVYLHFLSNILTFWDKHPHTTIQVTKHFGCGTLQLGIALIIFFWRK